MDFAELISDFGKRHGIADLTAEDDTAALEVDGIVITLVASGNALLVSANIGEPPATAKSAEIQKLSEAGGNDNQALRMEAKHWSSASSCIMQLRQGA